jgi:hypothetical protein
MSISDRLAKLEATTGIAASTLPVDADGRTVLIGSLPTSTRIAPPAGTTPPECEVSNVD